MRWEAVSELLLQARYHDTNLATRADKADIIGQVEIISPKIMVGIKADECIKEAVRKGQRMGLTATPEAALRPRSTIRHAAHHMLEAPRRVIRSGAGKLLDVQQGHQLSGGIGHGHL